MRDRRSEPRRPLLTPAFICAVMLWLGCASAYAAAIGIAAGACQALSAACLGLAILAGVAAAFGRGRTLALVMGAMLLGASLAFGHAAQLHGDAFRLDGVRVSAARIVLLEDASGGGFSSRALVSLRLQGGPALRAMAQFGDAEQRYCGQEFLADVTIAASALDIDAYDWQRGSACRARVSNPEAIAGVAPMEFLLGMRERAIASIGADDEAHGMLQALVCGYRGHVREAEAYAAFQTCGIAHLMAVSGAHLVIVIGLLDQVLRALRTPSKVSIAILVTAISLYVVIAGMPLSCIRAAIMSSIGILALMGKRRPSSLNALGIALMAVVAHTPSAAVSASLVLSVLSTAGIIVLGPLVSHLLERGFARAPKPARDSLAMTVAASSLSQLYACSLFCQLPLASPLANVVVAPFFPLCCTLGLVGALTGAAGMPFAPAVIQLAALVAGVLADVAKLMASLPYASVPFSIPASGALAVSVGLALYLWLCWDVLLRTRWPLALPACALAIALGVYGVAPDDCICMLDVGQGDAFLLRSGGATLLIDTGNQDKRLLEQLARCRVAHLDAVLVTHADDDHCGSLDALERSVDVGSVLVAKDMLSCEDESCRNLVLQAQRTADCVEGLAYGDVICVGKFEARVIWPRRFIDDGGNADSVVLSVSFDADGDGVGDCDALFAGDAEIEQLAAMMEAGDAGPVDVLKVGHHGSRNAFDEHQIRQIAPRLALIGVGAHNRYGHPTSEILGLLESVGCAILRTDLDGGMVVELRQDALHIRAL